MKIRKQFLILLAAALCSCSGQKQKEADNSSPEQDGTTIEEFVADFARQASSNQLDSLEASYPDIELADSVSFTYSPDDISIEEGMERGTYNVTLSPTASIKVKKDSNANFVVTDSRGLFAFDKKDLDQAKQTGLWEEKLSDKELAARMKDEGFKEFLKKQKQTAPKNVLTVGKNRDNGTDSSTSQDVYNNSDQPIKGSDYTVTIKTNREGRKPLYTTRSGKDIPAHGKVTFTLIMGIDEESDEPYEMWEEISGVKMKAAPTSKGYTGKEYEEYKKTINAE